MAVRYRTPDNLIALLDGAVRSAARTPFYAAGLGRSAAVRDMAAFERIPVTTLGAYRRSRLADVLASTSEVTWIAGPHRGQLASHVAVAEGADETEVRYELLADAVTGRLRPGSEHTAVVVASSRRRWFGAEAAAVLTRAGVPAHLILDSGGPATRRFLDRTAPDLAVVLSDSLDEGDLPDSVELCVTFRMSHRMRRVPQIDLYHVEELGVLAQTDDCEMYEPNRDAFYFERFNDGHLIVTSLYNHVRPMVRIRTEDRFKLTEDGSFAMMELSPSG